MPIPKPKTEETESEFVNRCMSDAVMTKEYQSERQRYAVCKSTYDESKRNKSQWKPKKKKK